MTCRATFSFVKGECMGRVISHDFSRCSTVSEMKTFLIQTHNACSPDSHALVFVWDEQMRKLTDDSQPAASLGEAVNITVNIVRKPCSSNPSHAAGMPCSTLACTAPLPSFYNGFRVLNDE